MSQPQSTVGRPPRIEDVKRRVLFHIQSYINTWLTIADLSHITHIPQSTLAFHFDHYTPYFHFLEFQTIKRNKNKTYRLVKLKEEFNPQTQEKV